MNGSVPDTPPGAGFGSTPKSPFLSSPFGYYFPTPLPPLSPPPPSPMLPPPPLPPLSADSYPLIWERQKPFSSTGPESLPFNNNQEYTQLPNANRYSSNREFPPNVFYPAMRDLPYPSYTEIVPFADCMGIGYPMVPGRLFTHVEQYHFANQPSIGEHPSFNKGIGSTVPGFGEDFASRPRFDKSYPPQPGTFEQQFFGAMPEFCPDLQFCRYSGCGDSAKFCEYSTANGLNGFVSYSETVNVLSFPSMENSPKSQTENLVEQSADGSVLISQSKICSNQNYTSMFRQLSITRTPRSKQLQNDQLLQD